MFANAPTSATTRKSTSTPGDGEPHRDADFEGLRRLSRRCKAGERGAGEANGRQEGGLLGSKYQKELER